MVDSKPKHKFLNIKKSWLFWAWLIAFPLITFAGIGQILLVIKMVMTGHGLDYFTTMWGYQFNYIGAFVELLVTIVLFIVAPIFYWLGSKEERSFKRKYDIHEK